MSLLSAISLVLLAAITAAAAAPRIALVRVKDIYTNLPSTADLQEDVEKKREAIMKDERAEQLRRIISELQTLQSQLSDKNQPLDEANSRKVARNYEIKRQEAQTLQQEFENFKTEKEKLINRHMVAGMRQSLDRIVEVSGKIAMEKGYEAVFDSSGHTNTGVPLMLFAKEAPDITEDVQAALKDNGMAKSAEKPLEKAAAKP